MFLKTFVGQLGKEGGKVKDLFQAQRHPEHPGQTIDKAIELCACVYAYGECSAFIGGKKQTRKTGKVNS